MDQNCASDVDLRALLIGRLLCGKWRIERLLGVGGMSLVFAATHRNGNRVAIKVLKPELAVYASVRQRFLREGYLANRVGHEGAAAVLDDNASEEGLIFLVIELIQGETLEAYSERRGGRLPAREVVQLTEQLLEVVAAAHKNQIVHRDIKPSNVFRTLEGRIKLLDFGIATLRESAMISQTASGAVLGTPAFMSPEQARGRHDQVDGRADLWAVGATMYRLLSGRLVHVRATPHETMIATATEPAKSLAELCPELPRGLTRVVDTALKLAPEHRFQSADSMLAALRALDDSEPDAADEPKVEPGRAKRLRLGRVSIGLSALGAAITLGAMALLPHTLALRGAAPERSVSFDAARAASPTSPTALASTISLSASSSSSNAALPTPPSAASDTPQPATTTPASPTQPTRPERFTRKNNAHAVPDRPPAPPQPLASASTGLDLSRILGSRR